MSGSSRGLARPLDVVLGVLFWYATSIGLTACNKYLFSIVRFRYPILVTFIHFGLSACILRLVISHVSEMPRIAVRPFLTFIVPIAFFAAADITLSNQAYALVSISVITVVKSSIIVVTYALCVLGGLETFRFSTLGLVLFILSSIALAVPGLEVHSWAGVGILCIAVLCGAARWVVVHHQLQKFDYTPLQLMVLTQPMASLFLAPFAMGFDIAKLIPAIETNQLESSERGASPMLLLLLVVGSLILALLLLLSEYRLIKITSSVTMNVAGVGKEIVTILLSAMKFDEKLSAQALLGIGLSIIGILAYILQRYQLAKKAAARVGYEQVRSFGLPDNPLDESTPAEGMSRRDSDLAAESMRKYEHHPMADSIPPSTYRDHHRDPPHRANHHHQPQVSANPRTLQPMDSFERLEAEFLRASGAAGAGSPSAVTATGSAHGHAAHELSPRVAHRHKRNSSGGGLVDLASSSNGSLSVRDVDPFSP